MFFNLGGELCPLGRSWGLLLTCGNCRAHQLLSSEKLSSFFDVVCMMSLAHGSDTWLVTQASWCSCSSACTMPWLVTCKKPLLLQHCTHDVFMAQLCQFTSVQDVQVDDREIALISISFSWKQGGTSTARFEEVDKPVGWAPQGVLCWHAYVSFHVVKSGK